MAHRADDRGSGDRADEQRQPNLGRWEQRIVHRGIHGRSLGSGGAQSVPTASSQHPPIGYHGAMQKLPAFQNEPYTDFSAPANRRAMDEALANGRACPRQAPSILPASSHWVPWSYAKTAGISKRTVHRFLRSRKPAGAEKSVYGSF